MAEPEVGGVEVRSVAVMGLSQAFTGGGGAGLVKSIKIENNNKKVPQMNNNIIYINTFDSLL